MHKLLVVVASLVAEHRLSGPPASVVVAHGLESSGSVVLMHRLSCSMACWIFLDRDQFSTTGPKWKSSFFFF